MGVLGGSLKHPSELHPMLLGMLSFLTSVEMPLLADGNLKESKEL